MTPKEVAEHLERQAEKLDNLATRYANYYKYKEAEICRQRAMNARFLAQEINNNDLNTHQELCQLTQLINKCNNNAYIWEVCENLRRLIEKFLLKNKEPYSTHYKNCGGV